MKFNELFTKYFSKLITKDIKYGIMKVVWPLVSNISDWLEDESHKAVNQDDFFYLSEDLRPGDIVLSVSGNPFSALFIPGKMKHAGIVTGCEGGRVDMIEATTPKVNKTTLFDFMQGKRLLMHCRPRFCPSDVAAKASEYAQDYVGMPYDNVFSPANKKYYCSEVVYRSYKSAMTEFGSKPECFPLKTRVLYGEEVYLPDYIREDTKNWEILWSN